MEDEESPSLWDKAYGDFKRASPKVVEEYEKVLSRKLQEFSAEPAENDTATHVDETAISAADGESRQALLNLLIKRVLERMEERTGHTRNLVAGAADFVLWAKGLIDEAVKVSPEASMVWAGVSLIIPILANPNTAEEANRDGFAYVTSRMRYWEAFEPMLFRLGRNSGVDAKLTSEATDGVVALYEQILEFQIKSVLRIYSPWFKRIFGDIRKPKVWDEMKAKADQLEAKVRGDFDQMNAFASRQEQESVNKNLASLLEASAKYLETMQRLLSVSQAQLSVSADHLTVAKDSRDISQKILQAQKDMVNLKLSEEQAELLQIFRLTASDKDSTYEYYKDRVFDRVEDTCQWFLNHPHFGRWLEQDHGPLLVSADPGCGKSVLAKYLIDHELPRSATICYFFFKDHDQNTLRQALCAILHQLFCQKPSLLKHAVSPYNSNGAKLVNTTSSLWDILENATQDAEVGPVIIVLDALDECAESELPDLVKGLQRHLHQVEDGRGNLKCLLSSRPYEKVMSNFQDLRGTFPYISIPGEQYSEEIGKEVNIVIKHRGKQLAEKKGLSETVARHLEDRMVNTAQRTYLWVHLVFEYLETSNFKKTEKGLDSIIAKLPESINQTYERILTRAEDESEVRKALCIVLAASRPLAISEMNVAMNISTTSQSLEDVDLEETQDFERRFPSLCGLFISIHQSKVYLLHQTAREFLLANVSSPTSTGLRWQHSISIRQAHIVLSEVCVTYLDLILGLLDMPAESDPRRALWGYSTLYWGVHFREAQDGMGNEMVKRALRIYDRRSKWIRYHWITHDALDLKPLLMASYFGHDGIIKKLLAEGADVEERRLGDTDLTALHTAVAVGHDDVCRRLLDAGADIEAKITDGTTPLQLAVIIGAKRRIVRLLLERGANPNVREESRGDTPLHYAISLRRDDLVEELLDGGADVNAKNRDGWSPLRLAVTEKNEGAVNLIVEKNRNVPLEDLLWGDNWFESLLRRWGIPWPGR